MHYASFIWMFSRMSMYLYISYAIFTCWLLLSIQCSGTIIRPGDENTNMAMRLSRFACSSCWHDHDCHALYLASHAEDRVVRYRRHGDSQPREEDKYAMHDRRVLSSPVFWR